MPMRIALTYAERYQQFKSTMRSLKRDLVGDDGQSGWYAQLSSGSRPWMEFTDKQARISGVLAYMDGEAAVPGFAEHVQEVERDAGYDVVAEYQTMRSALVAIRDWLHTSIPKVDQGGTLYLAVQTLDVNGDITDRSFTSTQTAALRNLLVTYRGTVD